ncbi:hypothetical protein PSPO01_16490 [Paraphaeosphaeria sporulosa]
MRTPLAVERQFPNDAYSPDDIGDATPRPDGFARSAYPIPNLSYIEVLANEPIEDGETSCTITHSGNLPTARPVSRTNTIASKREQPRWKRTCATGEAGRMDELLRELRTIQNIISLSHRCSANRDHEAEWNNQHSKSFASQSDTIRTAARITPKYRPTHSNNLTAGKIIDYAIHLEPSGRARNIVSSIIGMSTDFIIHIGYEGLRARPIAVSIETKTESRAVEEAKVQLGVWMAAQLAPLGVKSWQQMHGLADWNQSWSHEVDGRGGRMSRSTSSTRSDASRRAIDSSVK